MQDIDKKNKDGKNPEDNQLTFLVGVIMLAVGLFWLTQLVEVSTNWFGIRQFWGVSVSGGLTAVPLLAGVVWWFYNPKSVFAKVLTGLGGVLIVAGVIMSVRFYVHRTNLFNFLLIFVFIAGGAGLILRGFKKR